MKKKIDTDYILDISFDYFHSHKFYERFKSEIVSNGSMSMIRQKDNYKVKIFTAELMIIFDSEKLPVFNRDLQKNTTINGLIFTDSYFEGFHEGEQYFENHFVPNVNTLYGENAKPYITNLHNNLIHTVHHPPYKGWNFVLKSVPTVLNNKNIKVFGYYSGIVSKVQELVKIHKALINVYDNCEHESHTETETSKLKAPVLGFFCGLINKIGIYKREETESAHVYCERICNYFKLPYRDRVRQNYNASGTKKLIKELNENVFPLIDSETIRLIQEYLDSKQPTKQILYG